MIFKLLSKMLENRINGNKSNMWTLECTRIVIKFTPNREHPPPLQSKTQYLVTKGEKWRGRRCPATSAQRMRNKKDVIYAWRDLALGSSYLSLFAFHSCIVSHRFSGADIITSLSFRFSTPEGDWLENLLDNQKLWIPDEADTRCVVPSSHAAPHNNANR